MKTIVEERREIPVAGETDVLVIGGGLAGVAAAAAAARNGVKVTLLEKTIALGGLATLGHVCVYLPIDDGLGHRIYGGLAEELMQVCHRYSYDDIPECWKGSPWKVEAPTGRSNACIPTHSVAVPLSPSPFLPFVFIIPDKPGCVNQNRPL